ncbi:MAG: glycerol-3-phosphate 1-O-acyltransferase PlsY [Clostridiales bacterium]|nr:glycerol-3-phosphate 1-O-acyltransferase PlsY [Clostridiales bacterium]
MFWYIFISIVAYLIGSINLSIILCKKIKGEDIRNFGSGNAGSTNTLRTLGKLPAAATLLFDILKGVVVVLVAQLISKTGWILDSRLFIQLAGIFVILGHDFPIYYGFRGGKGVATSLGVIMAINPKIGAICLVFGILIIIVTRIVSLASVTVASLYAIAVLFLMSDYFIFSLIIVAILLFKHRSNIQRLIKGTENKIGQKVK